jgi:hypothetical protein
MTRCSAKTSGGRNAVSTTAKRPAQSKPLFDSFPRDQRPFSKSSRLLRNTTAVYKHGRVTDAIVRGCMVLRTEFSRKIAMEVVLADPHDVRKKVAFELVERFTNELSQMERN